MQTGYQTLRDRLVADSKLIEVEPDRDRFAVDVAFSSPSSAASVILARSASGPQEWRLAGADTSYADWRSRQLGTDSKLQV